MKVAIVGAGLIGCERIEAVNLISKHTNNKVSISSVFDINKDILLKVKNKYNVPIVSDINSVMNLNPDWVFVVTSNDAAKEIATKAFDIKANVLLEKPFGRSLSECDEIINLKPPECKLNVGFNYRFFAGIEAALQDAKNGKFGKLISVNLILGHGNSPGMENSWRFKPENHGDCGTDLGVHLLDLIIQLSSSKVNIEYAKSWEGFWNTGIQEEAHFIATDENNTIFNAQVSLNRWKSTFRLEINGTEGYGIVENRGRSYGSQSYRTGKRWGWQSGKSQSDSEVLIVDKDDCKDSFIKETISVLGMSEIINEYKSQSIACTYQEARNTMVLLDKYRFLLKRNLNV